MNKRGISVPTFIHIMWGVNMLCKTYFDNTTKALVIIWKCPFCSREIELCNKFADYVPIMTVHHFNQRHHMNKEGILAYVPDFHEAVAQFFDGQ